jgi:hypothetical protein
MFSSTCSPVLYAEVVNDNCQDAAEHHMVQKPNLLNRVKLKLKHRSKTKGSAEV